MVECQDNGSVLNAGSNLSVVSNGNECNVNPARDSSRVFFWPQWVTNDVSLLVDNNHLATLYAFTTNIQQRGRNCILQSAKLLSFIRLNLMGVNEFQKHKIQSLTATMYPHQDGLWNPKLTCTTDCVCVWYETIFSGKIVMCDSRICENTICVGIFVRLRVVGCWLEKTESCNVWSPVDKPKYDPLSECILSRIYRKYKIQL